MASQATANIFSYQRIFQAVKRADTARLAQNPIWLEVCSRLVERLSEINRTPDKTLCLSPFAQPITAQLKAHPAMKHLQSISWDAQTNRACFNPDFLPCEPASLNAIIAPMTLSLINDLPGLLIQLQKALKPDGLLLASMAGGETLRELRHCLAQAETEITSGISARIHPFIDVRAAGDLLARTGFNLPVIDRDIINITYPNLRALMHDLRASGHSNSLLARSTKPTARAIFSRAEEIYAQQFADDKGHLRASLEIITLTAWSPHASQPKPLAPGSGKTPLGEVF
jgi:hypothetical protein